MWPAATNLLLASILVSCALVPFGTLAKPAPKSDKAAARPGQSGAGQQAPEAGADRKLDEELCECHLDKIDDNQPLRVGRVRPDASLSTDRSEAESEEAPVELDEAAAQPDELVRVNDGHEEGETIEITPSEFAKADDGREYDDEADYGNEDKMNVG